MNKLFKSVVSAIAVVMTATLVIAQISSEQVMANESLPPIPLPLVDPAEVPSAGTFYSAQREWPPLPALMIPNLSVYLLASNVFVFDDRLV